MHTEVITWHEFPGAGLPDADLTVLAEVRQADGDSECWPAFWSGERWVDAGSGWPLPHASVLAWADMPTGCSACG